ncbi:hypothetical protein ElyMa_002407600 [Elysia marginata]|uniref:Uncharacterized protein n=1 Tax=Elysia marginata TaxID=1093978 RepID=A0AAV4GES3_9GAST|nr:hypothetical protein ElyMa_002407600 [Elysia marginata]
MRRVSSSRSSSTKSSSSSSNSSNSSSSVVVVVVIVVVVIVVVIVVVVVVVVVVVPEVLLVVVVVVVVISETALGTIEGMVPLCDVRSSCIHHNIILTPGRIDLTLNPYCQTLGGSAANTNFKVLGLTRPRIEPRTSRSLSECLTARPQSRCNH